MRNTLIINISIVKSEQTKFSNTGKIKIKCPSCHLPIEIVLNGLKGEPSISPLIILEYKTMESKPKVKTEK